MLPITDRHASTSNLAIFDHSVDNVTGEKSFMKCFLPPLALFRFCNVRWDIDVTKNGIVNVVVAVDGIDVGPTIDIVATVVAVALFTKNAATVDTSILTA